MLRRLVSPKSNHPESDQTDEHMSPSPGDAPSSPDSSRPSGLASVFKGLTGAKLTKSPPPSLKSASSILSPIADHVNATRTTLSGWSPNHMESLQVLRNGNGSVGERVAAADSLRFAVAEHPMNPVLEIWDVAKTMIASNKSDAERIAGWELLSECVKHKASTDLERQSFFETLKAPAHANDFHLQLAAVEDLTAHGRDLSGFDYQVIPQLEVWLREAYQAVKAARKQASRDAKKNAGKARFSAAGEEKNLHQLFKFIGDIIKFSSNVANEKSMTDLMKVLVAVCLTTTIEEDLKASINVIDTIVTFGALPTASFKECVLVLGSIFCLVPSLSKIAWHTISILLKSHNGPAAVRVLVDLLRNLPADGTSKGKDTRDIRGVLAVLEKLLTKSTEKGYPPVPFALLLDGLVAAVHSTDSGRVHCAVLKLINSLFRDGAGNIHHLIVEEDWSTLLNIAAECSKKAPSGILVNSEMVALANEPDRPDGAIGIELLKLIMRLEELAAQKSGDFIPRQIIIRFFIDIHTRLPDSAARCVLTYFQEFRCCSPSDLQWEENLALVLKEFYANRSRSSETRLLSLQAVTESYDMLDLIGEGLGDDDCVPNLIKDLLNNIADETNLLVLESVVAFMVSVAVSSDLELFNYITDTLRTIVVNDRLLSPIASSASRPTTPVGGETVTPPKSYTSSGVVTRGYVKLFMRCMNLDGPKTLKLFDTLVNIAKTSHCKTDARLTAMKLLFRLRADWANRVFLISDTESDGLAAALFHTASSRAKKHSEDASQPSRPSRADMGAVSRSTRGISFSSSGTQERVFPIRSASGAKSSYPYKQLWALPDPEALPESPSAIASPILVSFVEDLEPEATEEGEPSAVETKQIALNMDSWLNTIVRIIESGSEWEIYSMVLVHLPSQLTNHAIFRSAVPQIQELRRVTCEQIRTNNFQEPPNSTSLRRADVAICLFHTLTMILSYHEYFQKEQEDEIVQAFVKGISTWERCAKYCIHALSICCHELPLSTSKTLVQMLQKMAQIITQPHVAMHILEFLACLSRMQNLYVNFREDEYRIVFGICVRYLQYVRDKKQTQRGSLHSETATPTGSTSDLLHPNAADDLPQYVYALAYHVITFWFLALKLPDRANHVGWIAKNLLSDVDGGQNPEEQALVTLDFMQRVAYADADESSEDLLFTKERFGEILKRRWLMGNSIVTIEQSTTTGWSQITKRQPSGTSSYIVHENFRPRPAHQAQYISDVSRDGQVTNNNILPSHLMVQLMTSTPQTQDTARPIPLPNDEPTQRTVRLFDRNSTVDGHKVGVVYIGEGQTEETEILANVSGSSDYVAFLNGLGALTRLKGSKFNTQGLDREYDTDGEYTFCWRDKVTEMVFHVITQMPTNLERDPQVIMKKRHIGNDFVNIIFNDSGMPFRFDTFPSEFNYVNIVITPEARASFLTIRENPPSEGKHPPFYKVQVMSKPGFPEISPASETKMVSLRALPGFIRLLALNASVFCLVWANREGGEHVSSWRNRLREIKKLRDKHGPKNNTAGTHQSSHPHLSHLNSISTPSPPPSSLGGAVLGNNHLITQGADASKSAANVRDSFSSLRRSSVATFFTSTSEQTSHRSSMLSTTTNDTEVSPANGLDALVESVDFSKWA